MTDFLVFFTNKSRNWILKRWQKYVQYFPSLYNFFTSYFDLSYILDILDKIYILSEQSWIKIKTYLFRIIKITCSLKVLDGFKSKAVKFNWKVQIMWNYCSVQTLSIDCDLRSSCFSFDYVACSYVSSSISPADNKFFFCVFASSLLCSSLLQHVKVYTKIIFVCLFYVRRLIP